MGLPCDAKVLIFTLILLIIGFTNLAEAKNDKDPVYNYDSYEYPGYVYPDSRRMCRFFSCFYRLFYYHSQGPPDLAARPC